MPNVWNFGTTSPLKLNLTLHTKPSNVALKPMYLVPPTALNPISTHLVTAGASNLDRVYM